MTARIFPERLAEIPPLGLGKHENLATGACVMEAVSYVAGGGGVVRRRPELERQPAVRLARARELLSFVERRAAE
jgi:hypothetical protein